MIAISGCGSVRDLNVSSEPVEKPNLNLPEPDKLNLRNLNWIVVTPENAKKKLSKASKRGEPILIALTAEDYKDLGLNFSDLKAYIKQLKAVNQSYENYYEKSNKALKKANKRLNKK